MSAVALQALRNEIDTIRCYSSLFQSDAAICHEVVELRAFRDRHPLPVDAKPQFKASRPRSSLIRHAEAYLIFGEYCDREARRLAEKLRLIEADRWTADAYSRDAEDRLRNEQIAQRAIAAENDASTSPPPAA